MQEIGNEKNPRMTNQRLIIKDYLKSVKTHPSAETIYEKVRKKLPQISFGTVYRTLRYLKGNSEIQELNFGAKASRYDGNPERHFHFHCESCGEVLDVFPSKTEQCMFCLNKFTPGEIKNFRVELYGICNDCKRTKKIIKESRRKDD